MADHIQIGDVTPRIQYTGDGTQVQFTYPFPIFAAADMEVWLDQAKQTTGFTTNGAGVTVGGDVTFDTAPASGVVVTLRRNLAIQRTSDFQESGEFRSKVINDELDYLTAALQQVSDDGVRALKLSATDPTASLELPDKATRASLFLAFDADGQPIASDASGPPGPPGLAGPAGNMDGANNLSEITDPAQARINLGLGPAALADVAAGGSGDLLRTDGDGSALTGVETSDSVARANIVLNAFRIAVQGGLSVQNMVDGLVDEFEDETGVDAGASANGIYDAGGDFYRPLQGPDQIPTMTSATAPSGTAAASTEFSATFAAWKAMADDGDATYWETSASPTGWLSYDFGPGNGFVPRRYTLMGQSNGQDPKDWTFEGWNGSGWDVLDTQTGAPGFAEDEVRSYSVPGNTSYEKFRVNITKNQADNVSGNTNIMELEIIKAGTSTNMTLISNPATALTQPDEAFIAIWQQNLDPVTPNTDLKAYASRDGGTTWTQITLAEEANLGTSGRILTGAADLSAQPAGTSMKWKLETLGGVETNIHGVGLEWS